MVLRDIGAGVYKRLFLKNDKLVGAVLFGDTQDGSWYFDLIGRNAMWPVCAMNCCLANGRQRMPQLMQVIGKTATTAPIAAWVAASSARVSRCVRADGGHCRAT
jgi:NAD(P)H-nitrite reductase large subunit